MMPKRLRTSLFFCLFAGAAFAAAEKPIALMGFTTDVRGIESEIMKPGRFVYKTFCDQWLDPATYGDYSAIYVGEKLDGAAKGKNWCEPGPARDALAKFIAGGGTVIVGGNYCLRQLMGWPNEKKPDPLRAEIVHLTNLVGRTKANFSKAKKRLGYADEAGNYVVTPEGIVVAGQGLGKNGEETLIQFHGSDFVGSLGQLTGQRADTGADFHNTHACVGTGSLCDLGRNPGLNQKVLAHAFGEMKTVPTEKGFDVIDVAKIHKLCSFNCFLPV